MLPYSINKQREIGNPDLGSLSIKNLINFTKNLLNYQLIKEALVIDVDRDGGRFDILKPGNKGKNDLVSPPYTLKVRLLTNEYNNDTENNDSLITFDEYYALPINSPNIIDIPERGEIVNVIFDRPFEQGTNFIVYWFGRALSYANKNYSTTFKRREASQQKLITHSVSTIYSGEKPKNIEFDYDIKPNRYYEPFPENFRKKSGDIIDVGKSNTIIHHSFSAFKEKDDSDITNEFEKQDDNKRGYIEIATELDYIENNKKFYTYNPYDESEQDITKEERDSIVLNHLKKYMDSDRNKSRWEFLNSNGTRAIFATSLNIDARLIHIDTEKDWSGINGNVKGIFDKHFRDDGRGRFCGAEILKERLQSKIDFTTQNKDVVKVESDSRLNIPFDTNIPTIYFEAEMFRIISRIGKEINHAVLGEVQGRWLQDLLLIILHQNRTIDILNDRLHLLSEDFLKHIHAVSPSVTTEPLGLSNQKGFIKNKQWHYGTTSSSVGSDSSFEEKGSDSISMKIKERTKEERKLLEELIRRIPEQHSKTLAFN